MAAGIEITVSESAPVVKVITLTEDAKQNQGTIYGTVTESGTGTPLEDVVVTLFVEDNGSYELISTTVTIDDGEYVLENIEPDTYQLLFSKSGYHAFGPITVEVTTGLSLEESVALDVDPLAATGTISGTIVDDELNPIEGAFVGLYTVSGEMCIRDRNRAVILRRHEYKPVTAVELGAEPNPGLGHIFFVEVFIVKRKVAYFNMPQLQFFGCQLKQRIGYRPRIRATAQAACYYSYLQFSVIH